MLVFKFGRRPAERFFDYEERSLMIRMLLLLICSGLVLGTLGCGGGGGGGGGAGGGGASVVATDLDIYPSTGLASGMDMGVNTDTGNSGWLQNCGEYMQCAYPTGQAWGAVFITKGASTSNVSARQVIDVSSYNTLSVDLKGAVEEKETVSIGVKTNTDPDSGNEPRYVVSGLTTSWQTIKVPLSSLQNANYPQSRFKSLLRCFRAGVYGVDPRNCLLQKRLL